VEVSWEHLVDIVAIVVLGAICIAALEHGLNTVLVGAVCTIIGGIAGYVLKGTRG